MTDAHDLRPMDSAELFRLYGRFVARLLYRLGVPAHMIDDAVQDVFVVVHQRGGYVPGPAKPTGYLAVIATHAASRLRRAERVSAHRRAERAPDELDSVFAAPDHRLEDEAGLTRVRAALERIDPTLGATLLLADGEDEPCASIAAAMSVPVGTVYWRLHRARAKFVSALKQVDAELARESRASDAVSLAAKATRSRLALAQRLVLTMLFGWYTFTFRESSAFALLKETSRDDSVPLDVAAALQKHAASIERGAPLPSWVAAEVVTPTLSLLKVGAWLAGATATLTVLWLVRPYEAPTETAVSAHPSHVGSTPTTAAAPAILESGEPSRAEVTHDRREEHAPPLPRIADRTMRERSVGAGNAAARSLRAATTPTTTQHAATRAAAPLRDAAVEHEEPLRQPASSASDLRLFARAAALAERAPLDALSLLDDLAGRSLPAYLEEERLFITVVAQRSAGRIGEARSSARAFLDRYPHSGFAARVRALKLVYSQE